MHTKFWSENLKGINLFGDLGVDGSTELRWFLRKQVVGTWTGFIWRRTWPRDGTL
jgi:hypothetical protein